MIPVPNQNLMLPLSFPVDVVGIKQQAAVLEDLSDMACYKYRVRFDDGTEDNFTLIEEEPDPGEKDCVMVSYNRRLKFQLYLANDNDEWKVRELTHELNQDEKVFAAELASTMEQIRSALQLK
jgi:hypothetical protein